MPLLQEIAEDLLLRCKIQLLNNDGQIRPLINIIDELTWVWELLNDEDKIHISNSIGKCLAFKPQTSVAPPSAPIFAPVVSKQISIYDVLNVSDKGGLV